MLYLHTRASGASNREERACVRFVRRVPLLASKLNFLKISVVEISLAIAGEQRDETRTRVLKYSIMHTKRTPASRSKIVIFLKMSNKIKFLKLNLNLKKSKVIAVTAIRARDGKVPYKKKYFP